MTNWDQEFWAWRKSGVGLHVVAKKLGVAVGTVSNNFSKRLGIINKVDSVPRYSWSKFGVGEMEVGNVIFIEKKYQKNINASVRYWERKGRKFTYEISDKIIISRIG